MKTKTTIKRELNEVPLTAFIPPSLDADLRDFALKHGVSKSAAVRYIVSLFLSDNSVNTGMNSDNTK